MKRITLRSLTLIGWRGERERTTTFSDRETTISGANGLGKSRHFDAFLWCLFGKDREGRKDEDIKSRDANGKATDKAPCEVSAVLEVDGKEVKLRRAFVEDWVKPRGQAEEVFRGHHTDCWWNDVPVSVTEYSKRVASLIDETTFKLLTNPAYFTSLPWKEQRSILFDLASTPSIEEIAQGSPEWKALLDRLSGKSLSDFRKELSARKKRLKEELDTIQPKIDQLTVLMPATADIAPLEKELKDIEAREAEIDKALSSHAEIERQRGDKQANLEKEIADLRRAQRQIIEEERTRVDELNYKANAERRDLSRRIKELEDEIKSLSDKRQALSKEQETYEDEVEKLDRQIEALRNKWVSEKSSSYNGDTTCSHCGQPLPEDKVNEALGIWESTKEERLKGIGLEASRLKEKKERIAQDIQKLIVALSESTQRASQLEDDEKKLRDQLSNLPAPEDTKPTDPKYIPAYQEKEVRIAFLSAAIEANSAQITTDSTKAYQDERKKLSNRRVEIALALEEQRKRAEYIQRKQDLSERGVELSQQIADTEREEFQATSLSLRQVEVSEEAINQLFRGVTFQLFAYTNDDRDRTSPIEVCVPLVDGVPIQVANTASRVNAGLEIIRTLSDKRQITAPVFIDERESVQHIPEDLPMQIINLRVSDDTELTVTHNR